MDSLEQFKRLIALCEQARQNLTYAKVFVCHFCVLCFRFENEHSCHRHVVTTPAASHSRCTTSYDYERVRHFFFFFLRGVVGVK